MEQTEIESLLVKQLPKLKSQAYNLTHNMEDAEDLVNEVCLKVLTSKDKIQHNQNLNGWFSVILRNIFINNYRTKIRHGETEIIENLCTFSDIETDSNILHQDILNLLDKNKLGYNEFIAWLNGYKYDQIAFMLDVSLGTVKSRIFSYRKHLKEKILSLI